MLNMHDPAEQFLFSPWDDLGPKRMKLLRRSWAGVFREFLRDKLPLETLAKQFSQNRGRPGKELPVIVGVLILQQLHDLTDAETIEAAAFHISWHYALDIRREADAFVCERTLRNYRTRVIEAGLDRQLFSTLTDELIAALGVDVRRPRIDSTALQVSMRNLTRWGLFVETIAKFLRELKRTHAELLASVDAEIVRLYLDREGEGGFALSKPSESKRRVPEAAEVLSALVNQFQSTSASALESFAILGRWRYRGSAVIQRARRRQEQTPEFRDTYRWRAGVAAAMSRLKHDMGLGRLRVRGMKRVSFVVLLRALGLNIRRSAAFMT